MSDPAVTAYLTKLLCSHGGRLERNLLVDLLNLPDQQIEQILQDEPLRFPQSSDLVLARSPLRICTRYLYPKGEAEVEEECPKLHLCRHYLRGQCPPNRRPRCRFSHDVQSEHNRTVLKANELIGLNEEEIKILLFQNDGHLLPEICHAYKQDNCDQGEDCTRLHVCSFFAQGGCNRRSCRKSHNLLDSKLLLTCHWLSQKTIQNFQMLCVLQSNEKQQAPRDELRNEKPWGARGMSRDRGRGRPGYRRRAGSQDLLDSRSRESGNEGPQFRWRSYSRPPSQCSVGQRSRDEEFNDSDSSSDHGRYPRTRLRNLMDDWFTPNTAQAEKAQVRSSAGVTQQEETRAIPPIKSLGMSSSVKNPLMPQTHVWSMQPLNSRLTSNLTRASYNTQTLDYGTSNAGNATTRESYQPHLNAPYSRVQERPKISPEIEQLGYPPTPLPAFSRPTLTALKSGTSITSPKPSTISSTSFVPPREFPFSQTKPTNVSSLNRPVHLSTGGSSEVRVSSSLIVSNNSEFSPTKHLSTPNQKTDMRLGMALDSSMTKLSIAPSIPSNTTLYSTAESSSITPPKLATPTISDHMGASSSSSSSNVSVGSHIPSKKLQVSVKPFIKTESGAQYSLLDEDFDYFWQPLMATNSTATTIPSLSPKKSSPDQTPEICLSNIWKYCSLKDNCTSMHYCLPYRWQVFNVMDWEDLPNMEDIEKAYSDPKNDRYKLIDFQAMKSDVKPVRRLTTPSAVTQPEYALTTEWCWYWKNESGIWTEYGQWNTENINTTIQSSSLENIYLSDPTGSIPFIAGNQSYIIECREMKQKNTHFKTEREVRRRPRFVSFQDVKILRGSTKSAMDKVKQNQPDSHLKKEIYPPHWDLEAMTRIGYMKVPLPQNSSEFTNIVALFSKTMISNHSVKQIWRVQNSDLWELYQRQKDLMKEKTFGSTVHERQLFHGTNPASIETICKQNFDRYICGTSSTAYGLGNYFSREASYAHNYSQPSSAGMRAMFLARVLVGDFTEGNPRMLQPPQKYGSRESYDSCVDNSYNPSIFVVFKKCQVYPEYILEYQEKKTPCIVN